MRPAEERAPRKRADWEAQIRILENHRKRYLEYIWREIVPRVSDEIPLLIERGYADGVGEGRLYHVHIRYPRQRRLPPSGPGEYFFNPRSFHLLYHSRENPYLLRQRWIVELESFDNPRIDRLLRRLEERSFEYHDFFYGSRRYHRPASVPPETIERASELWRRALSRGGYTIDRETLKDKVIFLLGPSQRGFSRAYESLFTPHTIRSHKIDGKTTFTVTESRFDPDYRHPATVYFFPIIEESMGTGEARLSRAAEGLYVELESERDIRRCGKYLFLVDLRLD